MKVLCNTYPRYPNVAHAEVGDKVHWKHYSCFALVRDSDEQIVFMTSSVDRNGNRRSNGQPPILIGIVAEAKGKGWVLEIR